jgi:hypothetical protein
MAGALRGGVVPVAGPEVTAQLTTRAADAAAAHRWFLRLLVGATGQRQLPVDLGSATWWRVFAVPTLGARWGDRRFVEVSAGPAVGPVMVRGQGFTSDEATWALDVGLSGAMRLGVGLGPGSRFAVALSVSGIGWVRPHTLSVAQSPRGATVPPLDLLVGLTVDYRLDR